MRATGSSSDVSEDENISFVAEEEEVTILAEFVRATGSRSDVAEQGTTNSVAEEEEVTVLAEFVRATGSRSQSQPSVSVNDISADLTEEATGSQNTRDSDPETEVVAIVSRRVPQGTVCERVALGACSVCRNRYCCSEECRVQDWIAYHYPRCYSPPDE